MGTNVETIDMMRFVDYITVITDKEEDLQNILRMMKFNDEKWEYKQSEN